MAGFITMVEFHWICLFFQLVGFDGGFRVPIFGGEGWRFWGGEGVSKKIDIT